LGRVAKLELAFAVYMVVARRLGRLVRSGHAHPELEGRALLIDFEWQCAYILAEKIPPTETPTVREGIRQIATFDGFPGHKPDGEPGAKTLWLSFVRVRDFVEDVEHLRLLQVFGWTCT